MSAQYTSRFRRAVAQTDGPALGTWVKIPAMESMELVALAGFDFAVIDLEHSAMSTESAYRLIGTARFAGVAPIVRIPELNAGYVQRMLDAGAEGIMVPHIDTVSDAEQAVRFLRFPPLGNRGVGATSRAGAWGLMERTEYLRYGREEVVLIAQIESEQAARAAGDIAAVEGLDALLVGAADLSTSMGRAEDDPVVVDLIARVVAEATSRGIPVGNSGGASVEAVRRAVDAGFVFTMLSNDATLLGTAARDAVANGRSVRYER